MTAGLSFSFNLGFARTMFLTPEIFAGIAFIRSVEGKFAGTYIPTVFKGTFLYSILLFNLSTNFISFVFCNEWNLYILEYALSNAFLTLKSKFFML